VSLPVFSTGVCPNDFQISGVLLNRVARENIVEVVVITIEVHPYLQITQFCPLPALRSLSGEAGSSVFAVCILSCVFCHL